MKNSITPFPDFCKQPEEKVLIDLFNKRPEQIKPGLQRIKAAWSYLGMNKYSQKNILVAGTNGKGSTAGILWRLLASQGFNVGLFTSPHLVNFSERIQCSHLPIDNNYLIENLLNLKNELTLELYNNLSFFELNTLLALYVFHNNGCDFNILEVGLGGRLDSCNIVDPMVSIITSIDLDHQQYLGTTLHEIAYEKLGITRPQIPLFWGERFNKEKNLTDFLSNYCSKKNVPLLLRNRDFLLDSSNTIHLKIGDGHTTHLLPKWILNSTQVIKENFVLAYSVFTWIQKKNISPAHLSLNRKILDPIKDFTSTTIPWPSTLVGRFQSMTVGTRNHQNLQLIMDVCHNPASAKEFSQSLKKKFELSNQTSIPGFISILADKDISEIVHILKEVLDPIIFFQVPYHRSITPENFPKELQNIQLFSSFDEAWKNSEHFLTHNDTAVAICGSFFAVAEAFKYFPTMTD